MSDMRKKGAKFQPKKLDKDHLRPDHLVAEENRRLWREQKRNGKKECAEPGCITRITYRQSEKCMIHEDQDRQRQRDKEFDKRIKEKG